jgi:hypothetical protein
MKAHYFAARTTYGTVLALLWLWAIFLSLVLWGELPKTLPVYSGFLVAALLQRFSANHRVQGIAAVANWILLVSFIGLYAMKLGSTNV